MSRRHRRGRSSLGTLLTLVFAAILGALFVVEPESSEAIPHTPPGVPEIATEAAPTGTSTSASLAKGARFDCTVASVHDGDTFRCEQADAEGKQIRIRLSGVAARETNGSCGRGHPCPEASAEAATAALTELAAGEALTCRSEGRTYNRVAAFCRRADGVDLSCAMLASGTVARWDRYWRDHACEGVRPS